MSTPLRICALSRHCETCRLHVHRTSMTRKGFISGSLPMWRNHVLDCVTHQFSQVKWKMAALVWMGVDVDPEPGSCLNRDGEGHRGIKGLSESRTGFNFIVSSYLMFNLRPSQRPR